MVLVSLRNLLSSLRFNSAQLAARAQDLFANEDKGEGDAVLATLEERVLFSASPLPAEMPTATADVEASDASAQSSVREVFFVGAGPVDEQLSRLEQRDDVEVIRLRDDVDGIEQITSAIADYENLDAIHLVGGDEEGSLRLGNTWLTDKSVVAYATDIVAWRDSLGSNAELLIRGLDPNHERTDSLLESLEVLTEANAFAAGEVVDDVSETYVEVVFVDSRVQDADQLIADLQSAEEGRTFEVVVLESGQDGLEQIGVALSGRDGIDGVHIVSHGSDGAVQLGSTLLSLENVEAHLSSIRGWEASLTERADLLFYGCDLAATADGRELMERIAAACDCDVAASDDLTGHEDLGGDWEFEFLVGEIETGVAFSLDVQQNWYGTLETVTVTTLDDVVDGDTSNITNLLANSGADGVISLREAIIAANATPLADTIVLGTGTFALTISGGGNDAGDLDLNTEVEIVGAAGGSTIIDASLLNDRVFHVQSNSTTFRNLVVQGGATTEFAGGGAVLVAGGAGATFDNVTFANNSATTGGAIRASSSITVTNSTFTGNTATIDGGAVALTGGSSTFETVTIEGNSATSDGGGLYVSSSATVHNFSNITISGNDAQRGGGLHTDGGYSNLEHVTITDNSSATDGGGIYRSNGTIEIEGSIIAGNLAVNSGQEIFGVIASQGSNVIGDGAGDSLGGSGYHGTDLLDQSGLLLGSLADNGGPVQTHELQFGSVGVDQAANSQAKDGRGYYRNGTADIGAYERNATPNLDQDLVAHFEFESGSGSLAVDSAIGNTGNLVSPSAWTGDSALGSYALDFSGDTLGSNTYIDVPDNPLYDFGTNEFSISVWYNMTTPTETVRLLGNLNPAFGDTGFALRASTSGEFSLERSDGLTRAYNYGGAIMDGDWHHLAVTVQSSGVVNIFVDGVETTNTLGLFSTNVTSTDALRIGAIDGVTGDFEGKLDDVRIYARALSIGETSQLTAGGVLSSPPADITSDLEHHYRFDNDAGTTLSDSSDNNRDGTWVNGLPNDPRGAEGVAADFAEDNAGDSEAYARILNQYQPGQNDLSIALWYKLDSVPGITGYLFDNASQGPGGDYSGIALRATSAGNLQATFEDADGGFITLQTSLDTTDTWTHVSVIRSGDSFELRVNGAIVDSTTTTAIDDLSHVSNLYIGRSGESATEGFEGQLDDFRVYSRALASDDVQALIDLLTPKIVVDTVADQNAGHADYGDTSSIDALLNDKGADGLISLREAIDAANNTAGFNTIEFDIAGTPTDAHTINVIQQLQISDAVHLNGMSEPDATYGADGLARPVIEITGAGFGIDGLELFGTSGGSTIEGLIINDFGGSGIEVHTSNNTFVSNFIGTDSTGTLDEGNAGIGILVVSGDNNVIGGSTVAQANIISGNDSDGIQLFGNTTFLTDVQGNHIGADVNGDALGNSGDGVSIRFNSNSNRIGGLVPGEGNLIIGNDRDGVSTESTPLSTQILGNSIYGNTDQAIDLNDDGATPNDPGDTDPGGNNLQNYPIITNLAVGSFSTGIQYDTSSFESGSLYTIQFFVSSEDGQAERLVHTVSGVGVGASNATSFSDTLNNGEYLTAIATKEVAGSPVSDSSEVSPGYLYLGPNTAPTFDSAGSSTLEGNPTFVIGGPAVLLDTNVEILDAELTADDDFDGATLNIRRSGGANAEDVFSATGDLGSLTEGAPLFYTMERWRDHCEH